MKLKGKTQRGKNVVQRDGDTWFVVREQDSTICFDGRPGILIQPVGGRECATRWIEKNNDPNFEVTV